MPEGHVTKLKYHVAKLKYHVAKLEYHVTAGRARGLLRNKNGRRALYMSSIEVCWSCKMS